MAIVEMFRSMRPGISMPFTVDGPRGPRYDAKKGAIILAKKTGNPLVPFSVESARFWTINSWDRLQIPKPFTRARFSVGRSIYVGPEADDSLVEEKRKELQAALDSLVTAGRSWREGR